MPRNGKCGMLYSYLKKLSSSLSYTYKVLETSQVCYFIIVVFLKEIPFRMQQSGIEKSLLKVVKLNAHKEIPRPSEWKMHDAL